MTDQQNTKTNEKELFCYECAHSHKAENMQKYPCSVCGGRKCLTLHTTDENFHCDNCGGKDLCNDCLHFRRCCDSAESWS
jgi:DNA-directed RNA polymerase subunit RPC12/RpoP